MISSFLIGCKVSYQNATDATSVVACPRAKVGNVCRCRQGVRCARVADSIISRVTLIVLRHCSAHNIALLRFYYASSKLC